MPTLGVTVSSRSTPPASGTFTQTGTAFVAGKSDLGSILLAKKMLSIADFVTNYGARVTANANFYDSVDRAFAEGNTVVYGGRIVGPSKAFDTINLTGTSGTTLIWTANDPGPTGVKLQVQNGPIGGGTFRQVLVLDAVTGATLAASAEVTTRDALTGTVLGGGTFTQGVGTGLMVVAAATAPSGGTSDLGNVTATEITAGLNLFTLNLGPGNVSASGITITGTPNALWAHAQANNRFALADIPDTAAQGTITTYIAGLTATDKTYGCFVGPWAAIPGLNNSTTTRNCPGSAFYSGLCARVDASGNPNHAIVGSDFAPRTPGLALNNEYTETVVQALYSAGVNVLQTYYGQIVSRSFRTPTDPTVDPVNTNANCARLRMFITAASGPIGAQYYGDPIDGKGNLAAAYKKDLAAMLQALYLANALYGATSDIAYQVDTSAAVNTPTTIAQGQLIGALTYAPTPAALYVQIQLTPIAVTA